MIFDLLNPEKIWHQQIVHLPTSPVYCSHFTSGNPKKSFFNSIIHTYSRLFTLSHKKTNFYHLTHHTWKISPHYLVKCKTYLIWLKVMLCSSKHWWLWEEPVVMCGNWNVKQATSQQVFKMTTFCTDTCFQSFLPLINCTVHHALVKFSPCCNKALPQLVCIADSYSTQALLQHVP